MSNDHDQIRVIVHYPAAEKPFREEEPNNLTVGELKAIVLKAFGLTEGQGPGGTTITYTLQHNKQLLENPSQTLASLAGEKDELELKLIQQIVQGSTDSV